MLPPAPFHSKTYSPGKNIQTQVQQSKPDPRCLKASDNRANQAITAVALAPSLPLPLPFLCEVGLASVYLRPKTVSRSSLFMAILPQSVLGRETE
jgi:hypothetical protein